MVSGVLAALARSTAATVGGDEHGGEAAAPAAAYALTAGEEALLQAESAKKLAALEAEVAPPLEHQLLERPIL